MPPAVSAGAGTGLPAGRAPEARCEGCKRRLRRPSVSGFGPVCARRRGLAEPARNPTVTTSPAVAGPGQTELPLDDQPTLWSL